MGKESRSPIPFGANVPIIGGARNPLDRPPQVRDMLGRVLHEGDFVTLYTAHPQFWKLERAEPHIEPGVPPGMMKLTFTSVAMFLAMRDDANREFVRVDEAKPRDEEKPEPLQ